MLQFLKHAAACMVVQSTCEVLRIYHALGRAVVFPMHALLLLEGPGCEAEALFL